MNTILIKELLYQDYFLDIASDAFIKLQNQEEAAMYCRFLDYSGYTDWRLPKAIEITAINSFLTRYGMGSVGYWIESSLYNSIAESYVIPVRDVVHEIKQREKNDDSIRTEYYLRRR